MGTFLRNYMYWSYTCMYTVHSYVCRDVQRYSINHQNIHAFQLIHMYTCIQELIPHNVMHYSYTHESHSLFHLRNAYAIHVSTLILQLTKFHRGLWTKGVRWGIGLSQHMNLESRPTTQSDKFSVNLWTESTQCTSIQHLCGHTCTYVSTYVCMETRMHANLTLLKIYDAENLNEV